jgi:hypothetical protein
MDNKAPEAAGAFNRHARVDESPSFNQAPLLLRAARPFTGAEKRADGIRGWSENSAEKNRMKNRIGSDREAMIRNSAPLLELLRRILGDRRREGSQNRDSSQRCYRASRAIMISAMYL